MLNNQNVFGVIMAGGGGTRFWPLSRNSMPKQLLNLTGKDAMINESIHRLSLLTNGENIFVVTNETQTKKMQEVTNGKIAINNIISEPFARNTSACIGLAAIKLFKMYGDGVMVITPSDAFIKDEEEFSRTLQIAVDYVKNNDCILTIGIKPTFPATGYGYIKFDNTDSNVKKVLQFVEKPNVEIAKQYLESGNFLWNSGMFVWRISTILNNIKEFLPNLYADLMNFYQYIGTSIEDEKLREIYKNIETISIDFGVMEKARNIMVVAGDFGWNDVGSLDMLSVVHSSDNDGNVKVGNVVDVDTHNSILYSSGKLVATVGVSDLIVVETPDAILVCPKNKTQDVKRIVEQLKLDGRNEYL